MFPFGTITRHTLAGLTAMLSLLGGLPRVACQCPSGAVSQVCPGTPLSWKCCGGQPCSSDAAGTPADRGASCCSHGNPTSGGPGHDCGKAATADNGGCVKALIEPSNPSAQPPTADPDLPFVSLDFAADSLDRFGKRSRPSSGVPVRLRASDPVSRCDRLLC